MEKQIREEIAKHIKESEMNDYCWEKGQRTLFYFWFEMMVVFCVKAGLNTIEKIRDRMATNQDILIAVSEVA